MDFFLCSSSSSWLSALADCFKREYNMYSLFTGAAKVTLTFPFHHSFKQKPIREASHLKNVNENSRNAGNTFFSRSPLPHQFECFHVHCVFLLLYVFMSISVSMCRPTGSLVNIFFSHAYVCMCVCLCVCVAEGHLISGLAARHTRLQVVCLHLGAEQI